ncbi:CPBP family intramembrane glutamic endopeptidase [Paenibacillus sp. GCM10027626]|uniref:CPBP family intramembrane glutamic endopeptidase n=1 Tax=Paenibacillus sp. GCM10027626 TaxID=3273411 RepID=UPI003628490F
MSIQKPELQPNWKLFTWFAAVCAAIYVVVQVIPATADTFFKNEAAKVISKAAAEQAAVSFAEEQFKQKPTAVHAVHQSNSLLYGYLSKEKQVEAYDKKYGAKLPTDTFQVSATLPDKSHLFMYVHMETGSVVAWNQVDAVSSASPKPLEAALTFAASQGYAADRLTVEDGAAAPGVVKLLVTGEKVKDAALRLTIRVNQTEDGQLYISGYKPAFVVPADYESYVNEQSKLAATISLIGSLLLSFVLFVLAIIYAALYRKHTSFVRGLLLAGVFLLFYLVNNFNMLDGIIATFGEEPDAAVFAIVATLVTCAITAVMALSVYFSLVAGDGLWRSMGRNLWLRSKERGYGDHIWKSMWLGYLCAFILLGAQTVILMVLEKSTGAWSTTDVAQSPYNFASPLIFPLLAWCAAISEEAVYRFFGIALMKKWFRNTFVASLIPTIIWALGHVTYPIFPATTRLFELTLIGLLFCYLFLRFGLATVIFAHAIFDSLMMAMSLMFLGSAGNIAMGILYILLPIPIAALLRFWSSRREMRTPTAS